MCDPSCVHVSILRLGYIRAMWNVLLSVCSCVLNVCLCIGLNMCVCVAALVCKGMQSVSTHAHASRGTVLNFMALADNDTSPQLPLLPPKPTAVSFHLCWGTTMAAGGQQLDLEYGVKLTKSFFPMNTTNLISIKLLLPLSHFVHDLLGDCLLCSLQTLRFLNTSSVVTIPFHGEWRW